MERDQAKCSGESQFEGKEVWCIWRRAALQKMANSVEETTVALWDDVSSPASPDDRNPRHKSCENLTLGETYCLQI